MNTPTLMQSEKERAPWNQPLSELYDWAQDGDCEPDPLDSYD
jgi:hypothetical protein